jgi:hypothetical protein
VGKIQPCGNEAARTENKQMKKNEIVNRLTSMLELAKAPEIKEQISALIADLGTTEVEDKGKLAYFVHVHERVMDPAHKYPRQMLACYDILAELGKTELTLAEVKDAIGANAERLQTRQDPYRIYAFYQKRMEDEGWIGREKARI